MSDQDDPTVEPDDVDTDPVDDATDDGQDGDAGKLGDAGKKALDSMKSKWQKARDEAKELRAQLAAAGKKDDDTTDPAELRKQITAEARAEVLNERALDKLETRAAKLFADPEDARALLAAKVGEFVDDGTVDVDAIDDALKDLLERKPHLAATAKRFQGGGDGGARKGSADRQLTEQDLKRMTPEQIVEAQNKGLLRDLLSNT
jgi:hypothetical protein